MTHLLSWLSGLNPQVKIIGAFLALAFVAFVAVCIVAAVHFVDSAFDTAEQKGAVIERAETQGKVIENVRKAKDAAEAVRRDGRPTVAECLRDSRAPDNC